MGYILFALIISTLITINMDKDKTKKKNKWYHYKSEATCTIKKTKNNSSRNETKGIQKAKILHEINLAIFGPYRK